MAPKNLAKTFTEAPLDSNSDSSSPEIEEDDVQQPQKQPQNNDGDDSSSFSDASSFSDEETPKHPKKTTKHSSEEEEDDDDEGEDKEELEQPPIIQKPQKWMTSTVAKSASKPRSQPTAGKKKRSLEDKKKGVSSEEEEDNVDDDEGEQEKEQKQPPVILKPKKSVTSPSKFASKPKSKRPLEEDKPNSVSSKKPRKEDKKEEKKEEDKKEKQTEEGLSKKQAIVPFQKLFSDEDEIVILEGLIDYKLKRDVDPMSDFDDFCGFIKNSLEFDCDKKQLLEKVRRFKKKFNKVNKKLISQHDFKILELSKKIWKKAESVGDEGNVNVNEGKSSLKQSRIVMEVEVGEHVSRETLRRKGMELMGEKARCELSEMWDKVSLAQMEVDRMKFKVSKEEHKRIVEALKSGKH